MVDDVILTRLFLVNFRARSRNATKPAHTLYYQANHVSNMMDNPTYGVIEYDEETGVPGDVAI